MAEAAKESLEWFKRNEKLLGPRRSGLERSFKKAAVEAQKLSLAAERPMSVGVFGPSQSGKSFLIGSFISPGGKAVPIVFGSGERAERLDFLSEINPVGGDETTGLVTRFSVNPMAAPNPDYPVVLRMLREADIVKILANCFTLDLSARSETDLDAPALEELFADLEGHVDEKPHPGMALEDVFDISDYVVEELENHALNRSPASTRDVFWSRLERLAPYLPADRRAEALAPLWGGIPEFTALFRELKEALDALKHPEFAFARLDAIRDRAHGILHVSTIYELDTDTGNTGGQVTLMMPDGRTATLPKAIVTALTAELRVTLESTPWPFFEHTDLLDFPGARGRENTTPQRFLRGEDAKPTNRAYCYLRGKVAVLFDKYSADLDLNTMLLCTDDRNQEVRQLPELIHRWTSRTHGQRPSDRVGKRVTLFLCLTKSDLLFDVKTGAKTEEIVRNRLNKDVEFYKSWMTEWVPQQPFNNTLLIRNPRCKRADLFEYEPGPDGAEEGYVPPEVGLREELEARLSSYKSTFASIDLVADHISDPIRKIDASLTLNDGGISYLAELLTPTCEPDLKYRQIKPRAESLSERICAELSEYHEAGDIAQRMRERQEKAREVARKLSATPYHVGQFIALLESDEAMLGRVFMETAKGSERGDGDDKSTGFRKTATSNLVIEDDFLTDEGPEAARDPEGGLALRYADAVLAAWLQRLEDIAANDSLVATYDLSPEQMSTVVHELSAAARRCGLRSRIAETVQPIIQYHRRPDEHRPRVAMATNQVVNRLISHLARDQAESEEYGKDLFAKPMAPAVGDFPDLPADAREMLRVRGQYVGNWLKALIILAGENAASSEGGLVNPEENERLGELIERSRISTQRSAAE